MHNSVFNFIRQNLKPSEIEGMRILEIGSLNVNGSPREIIDSLKPSMYVGIDIQDGTGVNLIMSAEHLYSVFAPLSFDGIVCTETLEHVKDWRQVIDQIKYVLRPGGWIILTCRAPGYKVHDYPGDYWRFTIDDLARIFADMDVKVLISDSELKGSFIKVNKPLPVFLTSINPIAINVDEDSNSRTL